MRKIIFSFLIMLGIISPGFSQTATDSLYTDFGISIGLNNYQVRETVLNNIRHSGFFPALGFSFDWYQNHIRSKVELFLMVNMLKSRYEEEVSPIVITPAINYRQVRKVAEYDPDLHLFIGGIAGIHSHMAFFDNWDDSHIYWMTSYFAGFNGLITYGDPQGPSGYLELSLPLLSLVSRPPERFDYKVINDDFSWIMKEIHRDMKFTTIHEHMVIDMDLGYNFVHSDSFRQKVFWRISYINSQLSGSKELAILTHTIGTSLLF